MQIAPAPSFHLSQPPLFVVMDRDVAEALAQLGFTFAEVDAAWQYARNWILQLNKDELHSEPLNIF